MYLDWVFGPQSVFAFLSYLMLFCLSTFALLAGLKPGWGGEVEIELS